MDLKLSLILRVALVAAATSAGLGSYFVARSERQNRDELKGIARIIERQVNFQLVKIATGMDLSARFPDWQPLVEHMNLEGLCISYRDEFAAAPAHALCTRASPTLATAPRWFETVAVAMLDPVAAVRAPVRVRGFAPGEVIVTPDRDAAIGRLWEQSRPMLELLLAEVGLVSLLAWLAVAGALRPTAEVSARLARLAEGDLGVRLPSSRFAELRAIGTAVNRLASALQRSLADRAELARRLVDVHEHERRALARELHDEFGQCLAAINAKSALVARHAERSAPSVAAEAEAIGRIAATTLGQLRATLVRLRPPEIDELGLVDSLRRLVLASGNGEPRLQAAFDVGGDFDDVPMPVAVSVYRIAQECLTNVARHAGATRVDVWLARDADRAVALVVADDGRGVDPQVPGNGLGLVGMRERALALGGRIEFETRVPGGLVVRVRIPVAAPAAAGSVATARTDVAPATLRR